VCSDLWSSFDFAGCNDRPLVFQNHLFSIVLQLNMTVLIRRTVGFLHDQLVVVNFKASVVGGMCCVRGFHLPSSVLVICEKHCVGFELQRTGGFALLNEGATCNPICQLEPPYLKDPQTLSGDDEEKPKSGYKLCRTHFVNAGFLLRPSQGEIQGSFAALRMTTKTATTTADPLRG
jgi:hypothetical protein